MNKKERRNSGRVISKVYKPNEVPLESEYWDDWVDYRDGFRDIGLDKTLKNNNPSRNLYHERKKYNQKADKKLQIRIARKNRRVFHTTHLSKFDLILRN